MSKDTKQNTLETEEVSKDTEKNEENQEEVDYIFLYWD
jgi:hypothetical protein